VYVCVLEDQVVKKKIIISIASVIFTSVQAGFSISVWLAAARWLKKTLRLSWDINLNLRASEMKNGGKKLHNTNRGE
jgi:hypothetical protein